VRRHRSFHRVATPHGGLFVKRLAYEKLDLALLLRVVLSRMRGAREFRNAVRAHARGAPVALPLAFGVALRPQRGYESLLVYRLLPEGSRTLAELAWGQLPRERRAGTLSALARLTADLHGRGVFHLDLTPMNVVRTGGSDAEPALVPSTWNDRLAGSARAGGALAGTHRRALRVGIGRGARALPRGLPRPERRAVTPAVSVVMSTWERPAHLALALAGFLRQIGGVPFELIVADEARARTAAVCAASRKRRSAARLAPGRAPPRRS
jgi:hypothetical protein